MDRVIMSRKEVDQIRVFEAIVDGKITQVEASGILKKSTRQIRRKIRRYIKMGKDILIMGQHC